MKALAEKIQGLEKQLKDKKESDDKSEYDRAKKDVKEEATKREVNVDLIHEKLVTLETIARKSSHVDQEKISMILRHFHAHKSNPSFVAALVLKLVSSKDEEAILEKEQRLLKHFKDQKEKSSKSETVSSSNHNANMFPFNWGFGGYGMMPQLMPAMPSQGSQHAPPFTHFMRPASSMPTKFNRQGGGNREVICYRCRKPGHMVRNCPTN